LTIISTTIHVDFIDPQPIKQSASNVVGTGSKALVGRGGQRFGQRFWRPYLNQLVATHRGILHIETMLMSLRVARRAEDGQAENL
jgi:hypothetical protein